MSRPERLRDGIAAARELLEKDLDPRDMVAVGLYLPTGELPVLLSFTSDRAAARRTLEGLEGVLTGKIPEKSDAADPLRLTGLNARSLLTQVWRVNESNFAADMLASLGNSGGGFRWGDFLQKNVLYHSSVLHQMSVESRQRGHVMAMADAMDGLARVLRPVQGRKFLTLFSEGFDRDLISKPSRSGRSSSRTASSGSPTRRGWRRGRRRATTWGFGRGRAVRIRRRDHAGGGAARSPRPAAPRARRSGRAPVARDGPRPGRRPHLPADRAAGPPLHRVPGSHRRPLPAAGRGPVDPGPPGGSGAQPPRPVGRAGGPGIASRVRRGAAPGGGVRPRGPGGSAPQPHPRCRRARFPPAATCWSCGSATRHQRSPGPGP